MDIDNIHIDISDWQRLVNEYLIAHMFRKRVANMVRIFVQLYSKFFDRTKYKEEALDMLNPLVDCLIQKNCLDELTSIICLYEGENYDKINDKIQDILQHHQSKFVNTF